MEHIQIHVLHTGTVAVAPALPFGGANCNIIKASGIFEKRSNRLWLPVSCYYIEHPKGKILVDCGWHRNMSPEGTFSPMAQIKSLGSPLLFLVNQGMLPPNAAINEQLQKMGVLPSHLDYVLLTHLDCDHANGLALVQEAKHIMVSADELRCARAHSKIRYQKKWWSECNLTAFTWNGTEGPAAKGCRTVGCKVGRHSASGRTTPERITGSVYLQLLGMFKNKADRPRQILTGSLSPRTIDQCKSVIPSLGQL